MFNKLNDWLSYYESDDYNFNDWYDNGISVADSLIEKFSDDDWQILIKELPTKSSGWKQRLAYCLGDLDNLKDFEILLELVNTDDDDLYWTSLDSLSIYRDKNTIKKILVENPYFITKIKELIPNSNIRAKKLYEELLMKLEL